MQYRKSYLPRMSSVGGSATGRTGINDPRNIGKIILAIYIFYNIE